MKKAIFKYEEEVRIPGPKGHVLKFHVGTKTRNDVDIVIGGSILAHGFEFIDRSEVSIVLSKAESLQSVVNKIELLLNDLREEL